MEQIARKQIGTSYLNLSHLNKTTSRLAAQHCNGSYQTAQLQRSRMLAILYSKYCNTPPSGLLHLIQVCACSRKTAVSYGFSQGLHSASLADKGKEIDPSVIFLPALSNRHLNWQAPEYWNQRNHILALEQYLSQSLPEDIQAILSAYLEAEDDLLCAESHCAYFAGWQAGYMSALFRNANSLVTQSSHSLVLSRYYQFHI